MFALLFSLPVVSSADDTVEEVLPTVSVFAVGDAATLRRERRACALCCDAQRLRERPGRRESQGEWRGGVVGEVGEKGRERKK